MLLVLMNVDRLPDAFDVWQAKRLLAHAHTPDQIQRVAFDHPSNKFVELVLASNDAMKLSSTATRQLIKDLAPQGITLDTMRAASTASQLTENARELRAAAARAELAMERYVGILDSERFNIDQAGQNIYRRDPLQVLPGFMGAVQRQQTILRERMRKTFAALQAFYSAKADVAEFLVRNFDIARSAKERTAFADQAAGQKYSKMAIGVRAAQTVVLELERDNQRFNADRRALWNEQFGGTR